MLKLNKRDNRAIWAFDIKGHVRGHSEIANRAERQWSSGSHQPRSHSDDPIPKAPERTERASLSAARCTSVLTRSADIRFTLFFLAWPISRALSLG